MSNFRLIGITPLKNCEEKYRKNLHPAQTYQFYNNYQIRTDAEGLATMVQRPDPSMEVPENFYELTNGIKLNISAVVGKNGTGKSSLFEMLFYFIYVVYSQKIHNGRRILHTEYEDLQRLHASTSDDYLKLSESIEAADAKASDQEKLQEYLNILPYAVNLMKHYKIDLSTDAFISPEAVCKGVRNKLMDNKLFRMFSQMQEQEKEDMHLKDGLAVALLYEKENIIHEIAYNTGVFSFRKFNPDPSPIATTIDEFHVKDFFYTICINYSHHGLNSKSIGNWINKLFHKNDAYFTPVVINPMRTNGMFDVNKEISLSKERLMANLLYDIANDSKSKLLGKYVVTSFVFTPKISRPRIFMPFKENPIENLTIKELLKSEGITEILGRNNYWDFALTYLEEKVRRISERYAFVIYDNDSNEAIDKTRQLNKFVKEKKSHITKKIQQTLNFLKMTYHPHNRDIWKMRENSSTAVMTPAQMLEWMLLFQNDLKGLTPTELAEFGPPGFFNYDLWLETPDEKRIKYSDLSSGEQQMILNTNAILYHLYNINSIHKDINGEIPDNKRIAYSSVNIVLDEIELYYHPEMQRRLVSELIGSFERIKNKGQKGIEAINLTLLTHSPFILSDILYQNTLSLSPTGPTKFAEPKNTFGGNIHEILIENFFMDATIGEHSIKTIQQLINLFGIAQQADDPEQKAKLMELYAALEEKYDFVMENIGEDVIKEVLKNNLDYIKFVISL